MKHGVAEVKHRLKQALRSAMSNDSDKSGPGDKPDSADPRVTRGFGAALSHSSLVRRTRVRLRARFATAFPGQKIPRVTARGQRGRGIVGENLGIWQSAGNAGTVGHRT